MELYRSGIINDLSCNGTDGTIPPNNVDTSPVEDTGSTTLSTGAWAGIGVAIGLVVLGAVGGIVWFFLRKRRGKEARPPSALYAPPPEPPAQADEHTDERTVRASQLEANEIRELGGQALLEKTNDAERKSYASSPPAYSTPPAELEASIYRPANTPVEAEGDMPGLRR